MVRKTASEKREEESKPNKILGFIMGYRFRNEEDYFFCPNNNLKLSTNEENIEYWNNYKDKEYIAKKLMVNKPIPIPEHIVGEKLYFTWSKRLLKIYDNDKPLESCRENTDWIYKFQIMGSFAIFGAKAGIDDAHWCQIDKKGGVK